MAAAFPAIHRRQAVDARFEIADANVTRRTGRRPKQQTLVHGRILAGRRAARPAGDACRRRARYLTADKATLDRGKVVFAETLRALSFEQAARAMDGARTGRRELQWTGLSDLLGQVLGLDQDRRFQAEDARDRAGGRFPRRTIFSPVEFRVPVTLLETNACSPLARNALAGNIWDNFSSQSYKDLPSVGEHHRAGPVHRRGTQVRDAGRRTRLHAAAFADQPVVHCAFSA